MGFKEEFKYFKRKEKPPDLKKVLNVNNLKKCQNVKLVNHFKQKNFETIFGMSNPSVWEVYEFLDKPGLIFIKNPFCSYGQRYWIMNSLQYYTKKPSKTNLDIHNLIDNNEDWWEFCQREIQTEKGRCILEKLRWVTFGYHHDWNTKEYSEDSKCEFPKDLNFICKYIGKALDFPDFNAEAAIVNMYHLGSTLSGHTDHSEVNVTAPLFSFSFGQSAIFLIGGKQIEDEAIPILLESGDIIIMSGESRLCYHGVPKILSSEEQPWSKFENSCFKKYDTSQFSKEIITNLWNPTIWKVFENYVSKSRININVRQVLFPGQTALTTSSEALVFSFRR